MSEFKINKKFAEKYEKYRQKEELQRLKDRYGDEDQSDEDDGDGGEASSSDSSESEAELDQKLDRDFYRTLSLLKKKDPKIYEKDAKFYSETSSGSGDEEQPCTSQKVEKPMFLKDYERKVILERGGKYEDEDEEDSADEEASRKMRERAASPSYQQEQRELKRSFQKFVQDSEEEEEEEELLTRRHKSRDEEEQEEADYLSWLKGRAGREGPEGAVELTYLREYWSDPQLDERETFLRDYVLHRGYRRDQDHTPPRGDHSDSEAEGESFLQKQEVFERNYNFRFEEPDAGRVLTHPRHIATSVRTKDERRKRRREEVKERKRKEKEQKQQQLKELKNLKRAEITQKLRRLQELSGNQSLAFTDLQLDAEFDPQEHDRLMQSFFSEDYYAESELQKPQFDDEEDDAEEDWNWDSWTGRAEEACAGGGATEEAYEPTCEDPDFIMDADYDPSQAPPKRKKEKKKKSKEDAPQMGKKKKRKSHFSEMIGQQRPVFDPGLKSFEQYLDEYYRLDFEDVIDDLPCRFRYRDVVPNDFGLSAEEILQADERELNRWCSLKKTCMYRPEKHELCDVKNYQIKARDFRKKRQVFVSLYQARREQDTPTDGPSEAPQPLVKEEEEHEEEFLVPKKKKKPESEAAAPRTEKPQRPQKKSGGRAGPRRSRFQPLKMGGREFSRQRLRAYGLNPKRVHFRELYAQKRRERETRPQD